MTTKPTTPPTLLTVRLFSDKHTSFPQGGLRTLIFCSKPRETSCGTIPGNGMVEAGVLVRLGRKLLINEERFFKWLDDQQDSAA